MTVALKAEASPLIEALGLKPLLGSFLFPLFGNEKLTLIISGVGKIKAGAACSYLAALYGKEAITGFLNIGIGGHPFHPIGKSFLIDQICDLQSENVFFPSFPFALIEETEGCLTVDKPEHVYQKEAIYDMEGSGFFSIASKICPLELIHLFKIISDNKEHPASGVNQKKIQTWIIRHISSIQRLLSLMEKLSQDIKKELPPCFDACIERWHFTHCQKEQLKTLLKRWHLLCPERLLLSEKFLSQKKSKDALYYLESILNSLPLSLGI